MNDSGVQFRVYPDRVITDQKLFVLERTGWENGHCVGITTEIHEQVEMMDCPYGEIDGLLWMLDALEVASQLIEMEIAKRTGASVTRSDVQKLRASRKASHKM